MNNHFHLVVETPRANLVAGMKWLLGTYTARFNRRHRYGGHLFSGRYKALLVDGSGSGYLKTVCDYVHLNPVRAKLLPPDHRLENYRWSSWPQYLSSPGQRPPWLRVERLLGEWNIQHDSAKGRAALRVALEQRKAQEHAKENEDWAKLRHAWCWGPDEFREEQLEHIGQQKGVPHFGDELKESDAQKAERLLKKMLAQAGWTETELKKRRKGDRQKARMAARLRAETTMTWPWIAQRLVMGHWRTAANATRAASNR